MCSIDYDQPSMYKKTFRKSRKSHKCVECYRDIQTGETYQHVVGMWGGKFNTYKTCAHCAVGQQLLLDQCHGFLHQGIEEELIEHLYSWPAIPWAMDAARIVVGMRRKWARFGSNELMQLPKLRH